MKKLLFNFLIFILFFGFFPVLVFGTELTKEDLIERYEDLKPELEDYTNDFNNYINYCSSELSDLISFSLLDSLHTEFLERDIDGVIEVFRAVLEPGECYDELLLLKPKAVELRDLVLDHGREVLEFIRDNKSTIIFTDVYDLTLNNFDIALQFAELANSVSLVVDDSIYGGIDFEAIIYEEFETEVDRILSVVDEVILEANNRSIDRFDLIKDGSLSNLAKADEMLDIINDLESYRNEVYYFYLDVLSLTTSDSLNDFIVDKSDRALLEVDSLIFNLKKFLVDNISISVIEDSAGVSDANDIIESIYGITVANSDFVEFNDTYNYLVSDRVFESVEELESLLSLDYGTYSITGLVAGKIVTGTKIVVTNGIEDIVEYTLIVKGDVLGNGEIDISSLIRIIDDVLGTNSLAGIFKIAADMNIDDITDISDVIMLIDVILN